MLLKDSSPVILTKERSATFCLGFLFVPHRNDSNLLPVFASYPSLLPLLACLPVGQGGGWGEASSRTNKGSLISFNQLVVTINPKLHFCIVTFQF